MAWFRGRSVKARTVPRSVPKLYPYLYKSALANSGHRVTPENVRSVAAFVAANMSVNAHAWFHQLGASGTQERFDNRFGDVTIPAEERADLMIDFLWSWDARAHAALHDFVEKIRSTLADKLAEYPGDLPADIWT